MNLSMKDVIFVELYHFNFVLLLTVSMIELLQKFMLMMCEFLPRRNIVL